MNWGAASFIVGASSFYLTHHDKIHHAFARVFHCMGHFCL